MAKSTAPIRAASSRTLRRLAALVSAAAALSLGANLALAAENERAVRGTTAGLFSPEPRWSAGLQLGNHGGTGVVGQNVGLAGGAVNAGLGFAERGFAAHGDYVTFFDSSFNRVKLKKSGRYADLRARILPYVGGGVQFGDGAHLRVPLGVQYGMSKDPFNFFTSLVLMGGPFFADEDFSVQLAVNVGARVLL